MPFSCAICAIEIQVGEPMLSDEKMNLAHESCVKKATKVQIPTVIVVKTKVSGPGIGHPGAIVEPCLLPKAPSVCVECRKPAIAMCPGCHQYVHQDFGYNGSNCSGRHEGGCEGARQSRVRSAIPVVREVIVDTSLKSRNGKHSKKKGDR